MFCPGCGNAAVDGDAFCGTCGRPLSADHPTLAKPTRSTDPGEATRPSLSKPSRPAAEPISDLTQPAGSRLSRAMADSHEVVDTPPWLRPAEPTEPLVERGRSDPAGWQPTPAPPPSHAVTPSAPASMYGFADETVVGAPVLSQPSPENYVQPIAVGYQAPEVYQPPGVDAGHTDPAVAVTAPLGSRVIARIIDGSVNTILMICSWVVTEVIVRVGQRLPWGVLVVLIAVAASFFAAVVLYQMVYRVGRTGQSWGKKIAKVAVVDPSTGLPVGTGRALLRDLVIGIPVLGAISVLFDRSGASQGWGDLAARSRVVMVTT